MLTDMKPLRTCWALVCSCLLGLGAGTAVAQDSARDEGDWFAEPGRAEPAPEAPPEAPDYSPPPPDFQAPRSSAEPVAEDAPPDSAAAAEEAEGQKRAVEEFSPSLAPYGRWVEDPGYGRVWVPSRTIVGSGFVPYVSGGHWALTPDDAWLWVSDYPFGWITFHYGRWVWTRAGYWAWVPGYVYAPAWVDFHVGTTGYVGWVPLAPRYVWRSGFFVSLGVWHSPPVIFCPTRYVFAPALHRHVIRDPHRVRSIAAQTERYRARRSLRYAVHGPTPAEARIPRSALPAQRVVARPRAAPRRSDAAVRPRLSLSGSNVRRSAPRAWAPERAPQMRAYPAPQSRRAAQGQQRLPWRDEGRSSFSSSWAAPSHVPRAPAVPRRDAATPAAPHRSLPHRASRPAHGIRPSAGSLERVAPRPTFNVPQGRRPYSAAPLAPVPRPAIAPRPPPSAGGHKGRSYRRAGSSAPQRQPSVRDRSRERTTR